MNEIFIQVMASKLGSTEKNAVWNKTAFQLQICNCFKKFRGVQIRLEMFRTLSFFWVI